MRNIAGTPNEVVVVLAGPGGCHAGLVRQRGGGAAVVVAVDISIAKCACVHYVFVVLLITTIISKKQQPHTQPQPRRDYSTPASCYTDQNTVIPAQETRLLLGTLCVQWKCNRHRAWIEWMREG
ncbi:unnamed protein product [Boreogadus saida]